MIIKYNGERYFVLNMCLCEPIRTVHRKSNVFCIAVNNEEKGISMELSEVSIVDGKLPGNVSVYKGIYEFEEGNEDYLYFDCSFIFEYGDNFWDDLENKKYEALKIYHTYLNDIRVLHGFPPKDLTFIEQYKTIPPKSAEERYKEALNKELDEYLRIGEEIERKKKGKSQ